MQQKQLDITLVTPTAAMSAEAYGGRAKCLQRLVRLDLPVPRTVALSFKAVHEIASGSPVDVNAILGYFDHSDLICVRPSSQSADWGGPGAVLNIGMNKARYALLCDTLGAEAAAILYLSFVQAYSIHVARLDADIFDHIKGQDHAALEQALRAYEEEAEEDDSGNSSPPIPEGASFFIFKQDNRFLHPGYP